MPTLLGLPFDARSSYLRGAARGPAAIREALWSPATNGWSEGLRDVLAPDVFRDAGDVDANDGEWLGAIERAVATVLATGDTPILMGGDHAVTYPIVRAIAAAHRPLTILHVDAHADLYPEFAGDRYSHACPFARIMEDGLAHRLVQLGIRTLNAVQQAQAERFGVEIIDMRSWAAGGRPRLDGTIYLSIDLDAFDPAHAPGVAHREPGGLTPRDVIGVIQALAGVVVGADIVELNPARDPAGITAPLAAKLVKEIADRMLRDRTPAPGVVT